MLKQFCIGKSILQNKNPLGFSEGSVNSKIVHAVHNIYKT